MRQDPHLVPRPRAPYEEASRQWVDQVPRLAGRPGYASRARATGGSVPGAADPEAVALDPDAGDFLARLRREQRRVKRWMVACVIILVGLAALAGYAVDVHQVDAHLETMGPVVFLMGIANVRLCARKLARLRTAEASVLARCR